MSAAVATSAPLVDVRGLRREFPGVVALDGVDIAIHPGEVVGLVGKNGAGKSTLIKALAGVVEPDAGEIRVDGEHVPLHSPREARRLGLTFVHQELVGVPELSVAENIELGLGYPKRGGLVHWRALRRSARDALTRLGADIDPATPLGHLSIADQRLVMIAHALAKKARLLVLDEPTASLTESEIVRLNQVIRMLAAEEVAILYVSHRLDEIYNITERVVVMRDGRVVGEAQTGDIDRAALIHMITGPAAQDDPDPDRPVRTQHESHGEELLRATGLTRADGAVQDVDLTLERGEVLGLAGLVGAGRTELCRLLFGADKASAGTVTVKGRPVHLKSPRAALQAGIVLVPEDRHGQGVVAEFSVRENITLPSLKQYRRTSLLPFSSRRRERAAARKEIEDLAIKTAGPEMRTKKLSGGNQQKVVLAKWLARGADIFILDEPTHGIDVQGKEEIYALVERLVSQGAGVIFVSSEFPELVRVCDRALIMSEGRVVGELAGDELTEHHIVDACFAAREQVAEAAA